MKTVGERQGEGVYLRLRHSPLCCIVGKKGKQKTGQKDSCSKGEIAERQAHRNRDVDTGKQHKMFLVQRDNVP